MTPHRLGFLSLVIALGLASAAHARRVEISGPVEVIQVDDFDYGRSRLIHRIRDERTGRQYELEGASPELRHGTRVRVSGRVLRGVRRDGARVLVAPPGEQLSVGVLQTELTTEELVAGARKAVVLVVGFIQDGKTVACSDGAIAATMFTATPSVDSLYRETSYGQVSWQADTDGNGKPDVFRVAINDAGNDCDNATWRTLADGAATAAGVNLGLYQHRLYVLPSTVACSWSGYAQVGCGSNCWAMVATCERGDVYAHELGHNLGLYHSSFDLDDDGAIDGTCPWGAWPGGGQYCDDSDVMGISTNVWRQVNGPHKDQMGWISPGGVVTATTAGVYTLGPLETSPTSSGLPVLLRVPRLTTGGDYYVSFRRRIGFDSNMRLDYADSTSIHTRPSTNTLLVRVLADGQTFSDPANGLTITQTSHDATAARVTVSTLSTACGNGVVDPGEECDGGNLAGATCGGCAGTPVCTAACKVDRSGCTNGVCDASETCTSCPADCVSSGARCGNGVCEAANGENCITCPSDCAGRQSGKPTARFCCGFGGPNAVGCDPTRCGTCTTQSGSVCCGDGICNGTETSASCGRDCAR